MLSFASILGIILVVAIIAIIAAVIIAVSGGKTSSDAPTKEGSYFDGGYFAYIAYCFLAVFVTVITFGIAFPWMCCMLQRWTAKHTVICSKRQTFDGTGIQLIGKFILWGFLTIITFGIYGFWMSLSIKKWVTKHTHFVGEEDNNSYFDGGILGFIGTSILTTIVLLVPFVGLAWSNVIKLNWFASHTVVDSRRLVFTGSTGKFFLKYLLWGFLTIITFGIFGIFVPVKTLRLETENTIDHEHTNKALIKNSEYNNTVQNTMSANKNTSTEFEMELLRAGINDTTEQDALRTFADNGLRSAQYLYCVKYANEDYTAEPFSSMLKASAESGYAPAMSLYALTHELDSAYKTELISKAAQLGETSAMKEQIVYLANQGLAENNLSLAEPLLSQAVFYADVLEASGETLPESTCELAKKCVLKLRKIASGKPPVSSKVGAVIIGVVAAIVMLLLLAMIFVTGRLTFKTKVDSRPAENMAGPSVVFDTAA